MPSREDGKTVTALVVSRYKKRRGVRRRLRITVRHKVHIYEAVAQQNAYKEEGSWDEITEYCKKHGYSNDGWYLCLCIQFFVSLHTDGLMVPEELTDLSAGCSVRGIVAAKLECAIEELDLRPNRLKQIMRMRQKCSHLSRRMTVRFGSRIVEIDQA